MGIERKRGGGWVASDDDDDDEPASVDIAGVWMALDNVCDCGALAASATFLTRHGLVSISSSPTGGREMTVNGQHVPMAGL